MQVLLLRDIYFVRKEAQRPKGFNEGYAAKFNLK